MRLLFWSLGLLVLACLFDGRQAAWAAMPLFEELTSSELAQVVERHHGQNHLRNLQQESDRISYVLEASYVRLVQEEVRTLSESTHVMFNFFGQEMVAERKRVIQHADAGRSFSWIGRLPDDAWSLVTLTRQGERVAGHIYYLGKTYQIRPFLGDIQRVYLMDGNRYYPPRGQALERDFHQRDSRRLKGRPRLKSSRAVDDGSSIDVMIVYTATAAAAAGGAANIDLAVTNSFVTTNEALAQSCANYRYRVVHTELVNYTETQTVTDLDALPAALNLASLKSTYGADMVQFWVSDLSDAGGWGSIGPCASCYSLIPYYADAVVSAHELGHNMGLYHNREEHNLSTHQYAGNERDHTAFGYANIQDCVYTIMAYPTETSKYCDYYQRIPYFSSPRLLADGVRIGIAGFADNVHSLNNNRTIVAQFAAAVTPDEPDLTGCTATTSEEESSPCFIATAAFGSPLAQEIETFRAFRDHILMTTSWGQQFVEWYYLHSPPLAKFISAHPWLRAAVRLLLMVVVVLMQHWLLFTLMVLAALIGLWIGVRQPRWARLITVFILALPASAQSYLATPSLFKMEFAENPAALMNKNESMTFGGGVNYQVQTIMADKEERVETSVPLLLNLKSRWLAVEGHLIWGQLILNEEVHTLNTSNWSSIDGHTIKTAVDLLEYEADLALGLFGPVSFGGGYRQRTYSFPDYKESETTLKLGATLSLFWLDLGAGVNGTLYKSDFTTEANQNELYAAAGLQLAKALRLEAYYKKAPRTIKVATAPEGSTYIKARNTVGAQVDGQLQANVLIFSQLLVGGGVERVTQAALASGLEDEQTTNLDVRFGGLHSGLGLYHELHLMKGQKEYTSRQTISGIEVNNRYKEESMAIGYFLTTGR